MNTEAMNRTMILAALAKIGFPGGEPTEKDQDATLAKRLSDWYNASHPAAAIVVCDRCGGESPETLDACPYCGLSGEIDNVAPTVQPSVPEATPTGGEEAQMTETKPKVEKPKAAKGEAKPKAEKPKKDALTKPVEVAPTTAADAARVTEKDLDKAVAVLHQLKTQAAVSYYDLGKHLKDGIFDNQLWTQRKGDGDKQAYTSFDQFCRAEIGFSAANAYDLMDVASKFSREQVLQFGHAKLALVLKAPEEVQSKLLEGVKGGKSHREVAEQVKQERKEKGVERRETGRKKTPAGEKTTAKPARAKPDAKPAGRQTITIASIEGRKTVQLFAKPKAKGEEPRPAKKLGDEPWGKLDLTNDVTMYFAIVERPNGTLGLVVTTKREG